MLDLADALWTGAARIEDNYPFAGTGELAEVTDGVAFIWSFANVTALRTGAGLVLVDTGPPFAARAVHERLRRWSADPVHTAIYSHGHIDHVSGAEFLEPDARIVAHENVPARFARYQLTAGWNAAINRRQFRVKDLEWPTEYRQPDLTYRDTVTLSLGGEQLELHHARGETDDHTWTWIPSKRVLCCGDLFIWASPNAGNPQKVQRYPREWAAALRTMAALGAETLLPGHGLPVIGRARVEQTLNDTAALLESIVEQTLALMNEGARLDDVLHDVRAPAELLERPYLRPIYDDPEFIVRNVWRLYGGWWDGNPANLKPARDTEVAEEIAHLAGGADVLATRARELVAHGNLRLAGHLAELAALAAPGDNDIQAARAGVLEARADVETSLMAKGIFYTAAEESRA